MIEPVPVDYRELFEVLDQAFCTIEVLFDANGRAVDYRFIDVNPAFEDQTGLAGAVGRRMRELAPSHEEHWFRIYGDVALTGVPVRFEQEAAALGRWFDVFAFRVGEPQQRRVAILFRDISARRRAELEAEESRYEAEAANRAKDEFLAMLGHELRNPLAPMLTAVQLMRLRGVQAPELDVLQRQIGHLTRMVDDLLDVARIARGKIELNRQPVELSQVVLTALEMTGPILEQRRHRLEVRVPQRGAGADLDRARMAQVVSNLLTNAAKYSDPGSRIVITARREGAIAMLSVQDEGIGLAPEMLFSVFEPFVQQPQSLDRASGGLGLGLAIVRNIVHAHGGTVRAESGGIGGGATFIVELPAVDVPAVQNGAAVGTSGVTAMRARQRVLVVDDNRDAAEMLQMGLEQLGYVVEVAFDGPSALERARAFQPSTVLLDIGLPIMDGYEVAQRLSADPAVPRALRLLALTGYGHDADRRRSREAGFQHHLVKPIDLDQLQRLLEHDPS